MGCDIHPAIQWLEYPASVRFPGDNWSTLCEEMSWGRDYSLFARMAGVRCRCEGITYPHACPCAVVQPRGLPENPPYSIRDAELHTPSWLTLDELRRAALPTPSVEVAATIAAMESFESAGFKTRLVFAFDN